MVPHFQPVYFTRLAMARLTASRRRLRFARARPIKERT